VEQEKEVMTPEQFAYWLRGYFEINGEEAISKRQAEIISKHLTLVFEEKAKDLPSVSEADLIEERKAEIACAPKPVTETSPVDDLIKLFREAKNNWVYKPDPNKPPTTISCREYQPYPGRYC
jgi:hypothetical protein